MLFASGASATASVSNSTVYDNQSVYAAGLVVQADDTAGDISIQNVSIIGNISNSSGQTASGFSGVIPSGNAPVVTMQNVLLSGNLDGVTPANCGPALVAPGTYAPTSAGNNLSDDTTCSSYGLTDSSDLNNVDAMMDSFGHLNGTWVHSFLPNSPANDGGATIGSITTDQRGTARPQNAAYDIGAYESVLARSTEDGEGNNGGGGDGEEDSGGLAQTGGTILPVIIPVFLIAISLLAYRHFDKAKAYKLNR